MQQRLKHTFIEKKAEAYTLPKGLQLIKRIGCSPFTIEIDFPKLVQAFNRTNHRDMDPLHTGTELPYG
jgi:hypothetical protein